MAYNDRYNDTGLSQRYDKYRPSYPQEVYDIINKAIREKVNLKEGKINSTAVDVGCGTGLNTRNLAPYFERIIGLDISPTQIEQARKSNTHPNVEYKVSNFDNMLVDSNSAYLVTCAQALHYFHPVEAFYKEADRVLKPGGVLAIIGGHAPKLYQHGKLLEEYNEELANCMFDERLEKYKDPAIRVAGNKLRDYVLPYPGFKRIEDLTNDVECSLMDVVHWLNTTPLVSSFRQDNPDTPGPVEELEAKYASMVGSNIALDDFKITMRHPVYLFFGQKE